MTAGFVIDASARWHTHVPPPLACTLCTAAALQNRTHMFSLFGVYLRVSHPPTPQLPLISAICLLMLGIWLLFHGNITSSVGMSQCVCESVYVCVHAFVVPSKSQTSVSRTQSSALNFAFKQKMWIQRVVIFNRLDRIPKGHFCVFDICLSQLQHLVL